jgi:hypothetical protein
MGVFTLQEVFGIVIGMCFAFGRMAKLLLEISGVGGGKHSAGGNLQQTLLHDKL